MRIDKLTVQNYKGFVEETFEFPSNFTVIIGENATGKTSILDALAIAAGSFLLGIDGADSKHIGNEDIRLVWEANNPKMQLPTTIDAQGRVGNGKQINWTRAQNSAKGRTTRSGANKLRDYARGLHDAYRSSGTPPVFPVLAYHGTGRLWAEHQEKVDYRKQTEGVLMGYKDALSAKSSSKAFISWYKTFAADAKHDPRAAHDIEVFNMAISSLVPRWTDMDFHFGQDDLVGRYRDEDGSVRRMAFRHLSDGYRNMIGMAADIVYRCIKLNGHLGHDAVNQTPGIVLIDELDLHLHPTWQRDIVAQLKMTFPRIQFVCTTHSAYIVQSLATNEIINLDGHVSPTDPYRRGLEEVAEDMGVSQDEQPSQRYLTMEKAAKAYFDAVDKAGESIKPGELNRLEAELKEKLAPFEMDPALKATIAANTRQQ